MEHPAMTKLEAGLSHVLASPPDVGTLDMVIRRPTNEEREVLDVAELTTTEGVVGDNWIHRPCRRSDDGGPHPDMQLNIMNARVVDLVSGGRDRWALAGDQLYVDFDLRDENVPAGTRLQVGSAIVEVTDQPHAGCAKFTKRFGRDSFLFVNSRKELNLRGVNAKVVQDGIAKPNDPISKL